MLPRLPGGGGQCEVGVGDRSKRVALHGTLQTDHRNPCSLFPSLFHSVPSPSSAPFFRLSTELPVTTQGTQGSHLAPMVVLRAKDISDCGVSITDNKAPRTLITLLPYVLRAHNQVRRRRLIEMTAFHPWLSQTNSLPTVHTKHTMPRRY